MKLMWSETIGNHVYVYWRGELIYKKGKPSVLFNKIWPRERIINVVSVEEM